MIERRRQGTGAVRWRARYRGPDGRERSKTFARKVDAERWHATQTVDVATGSWSDPARGRVTVSTWAERWLDGSPYLKPGTVAGYESVLRLHVLPSVGDVPIAKVDRTTVNALVGAMTASGRGAGTAKNALNVLSALCRRFGSEWGVGPRARTRALRI